MKMVGSSDAQFTIEMDKVVNMHGKFELAIGISKSESTIWTQESTHLI